MSNNKNKTNEIIVSSSNEYNEASQRFRMVWNEYQHQEEIVKYEIVNMVKILEKDGLPRMTAVQKIINDHKDLPGFSKASIYRGLPEDMKLSQKRDLKKLKELQENAEDQYNRSGFSREKPENINKTKLKESEALKDFREQKGTQTQTADRTSDIDPDLEATIDEPSTEVIYDSNFVNNLIEVNEKYEQLIIPFETRITALVKGQDIPFIVKIDPYKRVVTSLEVDEKEAKKIKR